MFAVLAEDQSDYQTLAALIRRATQPNMPVTGRGFSGASQLLKDGHRSLKALAALPRNKAFIVCVDADELDSERRQKEVLEKVVVASGVGKGCTVVVPTWEIEAWILADINAAANIFGKWKTLNEITHPENIQHSKEYLVKLCKKGTSPPYNHAAHNQKIASYLDLDKVYGRCKSFRPFMDAICNAAGIPVLKTPKG